ncbi:MAG: o-succinylbenzoate--CoA ligase [Bacteroidetes bacterium]|nr:o-succinylbenzoate--CoA ligase [Bacteroidota bacterium]
MDRFYKIFQNESAVIISKDETINYSVLQKKVFSVSEHLSEKGVKENDIVAILGRNSIDFIILILSLWEIKAVPVPLNFNLSHKELKLILNELSPKKILYDINLNKIHKFENQDNINYPFNYSSFINGKKENKELDLKRTALIIFTSGSSGKPKGVKLSFNNLIKSAKAQNNFLELNQHDNYLASLPFYHIGGFSIIIRTLLSGGTIIIPNSLKIDVLINSIIKYQVTSVSLVITQLKRMIDKNFIPPDYLKNVLIGGSFIDNDLIVNAFDKGWLIIKVYGSTETCSFITAKRINSNNDISNSLGKVIGKNKIEIVDDHIAVKGESVMQGYFNKHTDFTGEGYFVNEDIGFIDENNELIIESRRENLIISGGENVSLKEIENFVTDFYKIEDAVVIGLEDDEWGEIVAVVVVSLDNEMFPLIELNNFLSDKIAKYKLPKKLFFVYKIPRNEMGKVMREELMKKINS